MAETVFSMWVWWEREAEASLYSAETVTKISSQQDPEASSTWFPTQTCVAGAGVIYLTCDMERVCLSLRNHVRLSQRLGLRLTRASWLVCLLSSFSWTENFVGENGWQCPFPSKLVQSTQKCEHQCTRGLFQPWDFMESLFEILSIVFPGKCLSFASPSLSAFPQASPVWSRGGLWILLDGIMEIFLLVWK